MEDAETLLDLAEKLSVRRSGSADPGALAMLMELAPRDPDAAAVVVVALTPVLEAITKRIRRSANSSVDIADEVLAAAWEVMLGSSHLVAEKRVAFVVAQCWSKAWTRVRRDLNRQQHLLYDDTRLDRAEPDDVTADLIGRLVDAEARGLLSAIDVELLRRSRLEGVPFDELAKALGVSSNSLRHRRSRAESRLREASVSVPSESEAA